jgi:mRNA-degrading endonuclease YafQ of YafQ-DinJ toxin-antitoxin module
VEFGIIIDTKQTELCFFGKENKEIKQEVQDITLKQKIMKNKLTAVINYLIKKFSLKNISDKYHTHEELYEFRKLYNAALFNEWNLSNKYNVHKSIRHYDNELCFGGGWFIVSAMLPTGLISNHYKLKDWDLFQVPEVPKALFEFDGHTGKEVLERLTNLCKNEEVR